MEKSVNSNRDAFRGRFALARCISLGVHMRTDTPRASFPSDVTAPQDKLLGRQRKKVYPQVFWAELLSQSLAMIVT